MANEDGRIAPAPPPPSGGLRVGVLSNMRAGQRDSRLESVLAFLKDHPEVVRLETPDDASVAAALTEMEAAGVELLVLNGGDGTVQHAMTHLYGEAFSHWRPWLAPIAGGRTNTIAIDFGGARDPVKGLAAILEANRSGGLAERVCNRPVQRVESLEGTHYGMFLGFGMLHRAVSLVHEMFPEGKSRGTFGAAVVTAGLVARSAFNPSAGGILEPDPIRITLDGRVMPCERWRLAMSCTLTHLYVGIRPFFGTEPAPLRVTLLEATTKYIARTAIGILYGRPNRLVLPENGYHSHNVHEYTAELDGGLILDGELFPPVPGRKVRVTAAEGLRLLRA